MNNWLFDDPPNIAVITTSQVLQGNPILYVSHDVEYLADLPLGWIATRKNLIDSWCKLKDKYR